MEKEPKKTYTVKNRKRLLAVAGGTAGLLLLIVTLLLLLGRRRVADLSAYTTVTRTGDTVTAVLDVDSLLTELRLPNPRVRSFDPRRHPEVTALMNMELTVAFTEDPETVALSVQADEATLRRHGLRLKATSWESPVKVLPRTTTAQEESPLPQAQPEPVKTVLQEGFLVSLLDEEGKGLNLRPPLQRTALERDRLCKEIFGNSYVTKKTHLWFIVYPEGYERHNCLRSVYTVTETAPERGRAKTLYFTVDILDLAYGQETGLGFSKTDVAIYDSLQEAAALEKNITEITELMEGVAGPQRPAFDYNGFVRFPGLPMSYPLPNGLMWSPTADPLNEEDLWRLTGTEEHTMAALLTYARAEIYARHNASFTGREEEAFGAYYAQFPWYRGDDPAPDRTLSLTEHKNIDLLQEMLDLLER